MYEAPHFIFCSGSRNSNCTSSSNNIHVIQLYANKIFNVECNAMVDMTLIQPLQRSMSFILELIDFSYTTSCRLPMVTFALGRTVQPQYIPHRRQTDASLQHKRHRTKYCRLKRRQAYLRKSYNLCDTCLMIMHQGIDAVTYLVDKVLHCVQQKNTHSLNNFSFINQIKLAQH